MLALRYYDKFVPLVTAFFVVTDPAYIHYLEHLLRQEIGRLPLLFLN